MTGPTDSLGNPVSTMPPAALAGVDSFTRGFLGYRPEAVEVLGAAEAEPDACLPNVYAGMLWMFLEAPEAPQRAARFLDRARASAPGATPRERLWCEVVSAWAAGEEARARTGLAHLLSEYPRDLVALKLGQYLCFNRGDAPGMLRLAHMAKAAADVPHYHAMTAFAYEQCHLLGEAEAAAHRALAGDPTEPWAHHALAHVMLTEGRIAEGSAFMAERSVTWTGLNSFMSTHNWWHLALFRLSLGDTDAVLAIYDTHVWGIDKTYSQDQVGAVSLLARMELAGLDVGSRWEDVADHLAARAADTVEPFLTLQYLYGLARADRPQAEDLMRAIHSRAAEAGSPAAQVWAELALPAAQGIRAFLKGDHATASARLGAALPRLQDVGGSHAQRDLFDQIHLAALVAGGRLVPAQQTLELRRRHDPLGVPLNRMLADVYARLGLPAEAAVARQRAGLA